MTEPEKARAWRERHKFTREQLAERVGYSVEAIYWFEKGINPPRGKKRKRGPIEPWVWQRYKLACLGWQSSQNKQWNWS